MHEEIRKRIPRPSVTSSPPGRTLVNIPTIFSTAATPAVSLTIAQPVPGSVTATPRYRWDFGDGLTATGPGLPYRPGDVPSRNPNRYVHAVYDTSGTKHVTLTVTWAVQFQLDGVTDVPLAPIVFTASEDKDVTTAQAVLVNN